MAIKKMTDGPHAGKWRVTVRNGNKPGGKKRYLRRHYDTYEEADFYHERLQAQIISAEAATIEELGNRWLDSQEARNLTYGTRQRYAQQHRNWIVPRIGDIPAVNFQKRHAEAFRDELIPHLDPSSIRVTFAMLSHAIKGQSDATAGITLPSKRRAEVKFLTVEDAKRFIDAASESYLRAAFVLAITTGMRASELGGLKWTDIDFHSKQLSLSRQHQQQDGKHCMVPPKRDSRRMIALTDFAIEALRRHKEMTTKPRWNENVRRHPKEFVFTGKTGGFLTQAETLKEFRRVAKLAGLDESTRMHDLRHTTAVMLLSLGENAKVVSDMLGHSSVAFTLDTYAHVTPGMQAQAAARLDGALT